MLPEAAREAHAAFEEPSNAARMQQLQRDCKFRGNTRRAKDFLILFYFSGQGDIAKFFQMCIPLATEILGNVVVKYGFEATQNGVLISEIS